MSTFRKQYRQLDPQEAALVESIKTKAEALEQDFLSAPAGRELSVARTKLEEAVMWAVKAVTA